MWVSKVFPIIARTLLAVIAVSTLFPAAFGKLINEPKDVVAVEGSTTVIECSTDLPHPVKWVKLTPEESYSTTIYQGHRGVFTGNYSERFSIGPNQTTSHNLVIKDVRPEDAGEYICIDDTGYGASKGDYAAAQLTVIGKSLDCEHNIEEAGWFYDSDCANISSIRMMCSINCTGSGYISINWYQGGAPGVSQSHKCSGTRVTSSVEVPLSESLNQTSFICSANNPSSVNEVDSLDVSQTFHTIVLKSMPTVRTLELPIRSPSNIKCLDDENNCKFVWRRSDGQVIAETNELMNGPESNFTGNITCNAYCPLIDNRTCNKSLVFIGTAKDADKSSSNTVWVVVILLIVLIVLIILIILLIIWCKQDSRWRSCINWCRKQFSSKSSKPSNGVDSVVEVNPNQNDVHDGPPVTNLPEEVQDHMNEEDNTESVSLFRSEPNKKVNETQPSFDSGIQESSFIDDDGNITNNN